MPFLWRNVVKFTLYFTSFYIGLYSYSKQGVNFICRGAAVFLRCGFLGLGAFFLKNQGVIHLLFHSLTPRVYDI
jgi:hypothetical protein